MRVVVSCCWGSSVGRVVSPINILLDARDARSLGFTTLIPTWTTNTA